MGRVFDRTNIKIIGFEWDKGNKEKNLIKHKVEIKECEEIFFNEPILFFEDAKHSEKEIRLVAYGKTDKGRKLTIVFTLRKSLIRIISARDQNLKEGKIYEKA